MEEENVNDLEKAERPLSPILNNSNINRKRVIERKRSSKTRVRLAKRFSEGDTNKPAGSDDFQFKIPMSPPVKKFKHNVSGFCTGSGKNIVIPPESLKMPSNLFCDILKTDSIETNPMVFKKDFSRLHSSTFNMNTFETSLGDTQILLDAEAAACTSLTNSQKVGLSLNTQDDTEGSSKSFLGFTEGSYQISRKLVVAFQNCLDNCEKDVGETISEISLLDNTLCQVFAEEDLTLIGTINSRNCSDNKNEIVSEDKLPQNKVVGSEAHLSPYEDLLSNNQEFFIDFKIQSSTDEKITPAVGFSSATGEEIPHIKNLLCKELQNAEGFVKNNSINDLHTKLGENIELLKKEPAVLDLHCSKQPGLAYRKDDATNFQLKTIGFSSADVSEKAYVNAQSEKLLSRLDDEKYLKTFGFVSASGKKIDVDEKAWTNTKNLFRDDLICASGLEESQRSIFPNPALKNKCGFLTDNDITVKSSSSTNTRLHTDGFVCASGKNIVIGEKAWATTKNLFGDDLDNNSRLEEYHGSISSKSACQKISGFSTASGKTIDISDKVWKNTKDFFSSELCDKSNTQLATTGFACASGKNIDISEKAWTKTKNLFSDDLVCNSGPEEFQSLISTNSALQKNSGFSTASGKTIDISEKVWNNTKDFFSSELCNKSNTHLATVGFVSASGKNIDVGEKAWTKTKHLFGDDFNCNLEPEECRGSSYSNSAHQKTIGFSTASGNTIDVTEKAWSSTKDIFSDKSYTPTNTVRFSTAENAGFGTQCRGTGFSTEGRKKWMEMESKNLPTDEGTRDNELTNKDDDSLRDSNINRSLPYETPEKQRGVKKKLRISGCKQIQIRNDSLDKAKMFFKELEDNTVSASNTPARCNIYSSTPLKQHVDLSKQVLTKTLLTNLNITPVKRSHEESHCENSAIVIKKHTDGNTDVWIEEMQKQCEYLRKQLDKVSERQKALEGQQLFLHSQNRSKTRDVLGVLSEKKKTGERVSLRQALGNRRPGDVINEDGAAKSFYWNITPQNATMVHFTCSWDNESPVYTKDGAILIPTLDNLIGLSEIKEAFKAMLGVDPKLIPRGWIDNHFKWIVWKLSSYERNFPDVFSEALSAENIIQQLKYRYDREIDKAERPALRRILETDDVPQKRLVLCVSDIFRFENSIEVELTDGWYSIRTIIDELLKQQINSSKIVIGTKLITQCAEILNCDGCHPLEIPDHVRLKINFNCTRRAAWDAKLGYQKISKPFPVTLDSVHCDGGIIACVKIYIARVYPLRFMEKVDKGKPVWRNAKAEEKRAQAWEDEKTKELEVLQQRVREEYEKELRIKRDTKVCSKNLSEINSAETLYTMMEASNDPDSFKERLTSSQLSSIQNYHHNVYIERNNEISTRMSKELKKLKKSDRCVHPLLKLLIVDRLRAGQPRVLNIWKPTEEHMQLLKEGSNFSIYNITLRSNGEFSSINKTHFKTEPNTPGDNKWQRRVLSILDLQQSIPNLLIKEFDTIGTVIVINKSENYQEMWVADCNGNLLLVKIFDGASKCCLLDNINQGHNVAFMNLIYCEPKVGFGQGIANQFSVVTCIPQKKFLQEALTKHIEQLPKNKAFIEDCDAKIKKIQVTHAKGMNSSIGVSTLSLLVDSGTVFDDSMDDNTLIPSHLTSTDVAMSLMDTDQFSHLFTE
ncbi:hypothetical protein FQR65_LT03584 [Abscondita terminalis]|nr:hypothetical protein FQR65_LT03584 [Abscondita terminalis]